jgi:hypothetical protein
MALKVSDQGAGGHQPGFLINAEKNEQDAGRPVQK